MFTPPPLSEVDAIRPLMGPYTPEEIIMAWWMQTKEGQPMNVMLFYDQYDDFDEYIKENTPEGIAAQIDWWTRTRIYNAGESLVDQHLGNYYCYFTPESWDKRQATLCLSGDRAVYIPTWKDGDFDACQLDEDGLKNGWCNYDPSPEEMACELEMDNESWADSIRYSDNDEMIEAYDDLVENQDGKYKELFDRLAFYAKERRALAEAVEA